ncbi:MAG: hypothetical protein RLZZ165_2411, partial [Bacteroidota bacterium]
MIQKSILLLLITLGFVAQKSQTLTITDPVKYNDYEGNLFYVMEGEFKKLLAMLKEPPEDKTTATNQLEQVLTAARNGIDSLQKLSPVPDEIEMGLRQVRINLFKLYEQTVDNDFRTIIDQLYLETPDLKVIREVLSRRLQTTEADRINWLLSGFAAQKSQTLTITDPV